MRYVPISTKTPIPPPVGVPAAMRLKPSMRVEVRAKEKQAHVTPTPAKKTSSLKNIQALFKYDGPVLPVSAMRVADDRG